MNSVIKYDDSTKVIFEPATQKVLDRLANSYPNVEIECKNEASLENRWFVQVAKSEEHLPVGYFGSTVKEAAKRIASALKIEIPPE